MGGEVVYGSAMTNLVEEVKVEFKVLRAVVAMGLLVGVFLMVVVKKAVILVVIRGRWSCRGGNRS